MARGLDAEWFWTDRWTRSRGFGLPMEARGLYREMLTQAWRRGAALPNDHEVIRRVTGCTLKEWKRCWPLIEKFWVVDGDGLVNPTQVVIYLEAQTASKRASDRARAGADAMHKRRTSDAQAPAQALLEHQPPVSGLQSQNKTPLPPARGRRKSRTQRQAEAKRFPENPWVCPHTPPCGNHVTCDVVAQRKQAS